jgi:multidrug transporter EmrE-like cation transporter
MASKDFIDKWITSINWKWGSFSMLPIFFGVVMALIDIGMMGALKMISTGAVSSTFALPFAVLLYACEPLIFLKALSYENMIVTNLVWNLMSDVIVTLQGVLVFGEKIQGMRWVAVSMSLFALGLFAYTDKD